ncbi:hypothetical protein, partial [Streptomyces sp. N35]|uniref:hypothetical protein n=1 Tax=Streptomyces sp. N35 TaxID=2795730 RepID=UPI001F271BB0
SVRAFCVSGTGCGRTGPVPRVQDRPHAAEAVLTPAPDPGTSTGRQELLVRQEVAHGDIRAA